jgi:hypothetical protein
LIDKAGTRGGAVPLKVERRKLSVLCVRYIQIAATRDVFLVRSTDCCQETDCNRGIQTASEV